MRLIDADELIREIEEELWDWESVNGIQSSTVLKQTITDIGNQPTIEAEPVKHGHWASASTYIYYWECDACKWLNPVKSHYCPNCGAKMEDTLL